MQKLESLYVPTVGDEVTTGWLQAVLIAHFPQARVQANRLHRIGEGYGFASQVFRCGLQGVGVPPSVVVKLWRTDGPGGTREVPFYHAFAAKLSETIAACYHAAMDDETQCGVLVLEDLEGAMQGDCTLQLPLNEAVALAEVLATIHAAWWGSDDLAEAEWLPSVLRAERDGEWFASRRALFLQRWGERLDAEGRHLLEQAEVLQARANERLQGAAVTLLHNDFHLDNVVFRRETGRPIVLDWGRVAKGPAVLDLVQLGFAIGQIEDYDHVLAAYLAGLARGGVTDYEDEAALRHHLGGAVLRMFIGATCGAALWEPGSPREVEIIERHIERGVRAVEVWRRLEPELFG